MHLELDDAERAFQRQVRERMAQLMHPALREEVTAGDGGGPHYLAALEELGREGWLSLGWPTEHGGQNRPFFEQFLFYDEVHRSGFPIPLLTLNTVAPTLMSFGSAEQKAKFLPPIRAGKLHFSIGYTEPHAGTDLASLRTKAERDGDDFLVSGQKIFTSLARHADYLWAAVRTGAPDSRHGGISILIIDMKSEGLSLSPIRNVGDSDIYAVYLDSVRVPAHHLVGAENQGFRLITTQLNHERISLMTYGPLRRLVDETWAFAAQHKQPDGTLLADVPWVQLKLGQVEARLEALKLFNWRQAWAMGQGHVSPADASAIKVYGSELYVEAYAALMEVLGEASLLKRDAPGAVLHADVERHYRATLVLTFGGGTNEIQRDIIATVGLGLPRSKR